MATVIRPYGIKFFDQLKNGDNFDENLTSYSSILAGNVGQKVRAEVTIDIGTFVELKNWTFVYITESGGNPLTSSIRMPSVNWQNEGFQIGDTVNLVGVGGVSNGIGTVTAINGTELVISNDSGTWKSQNDATTQQYGTTGYDYISNISDLTALEYKFGLPSTSEDITFDSIHTNTEKSYKVKDIPTVISQPAVSNVANTGNIAWIDGQITCEYIQDVNDLNIINQGTSWKRYTILHDFIITDEYLSGEIASIKGEENAPERFDGTNTLRYVAELNFYRSFGLPNTRKTGTIDTKEGNVAYLNESFNGNPVNFGVENLVYYDNTETKSASALSLSNEINVAFDVTSADGVFIAGQRVVLTMMSLRESQAYQYNTSKNWVEIWTHSALLLEDGELAKAQDQFLDATVTYVDANNISVDVDIDLTASQSSQLSVGDYYILQVDIQDDSQDVNNGGKALLTLDINQYTINNDITGLFGVNSFNIFSHSQIGGTGTTNGLFNVEEGFQVSGTFLKNNDDNSLVTRFSIDLVVFDDATETWETLRSANFDLSSSIVSNGTQYIDLDSTRNYILKDGDPFNALTLITQPFFGTTDIGGFTVGFKNPWQSWVEWKQANISYFDANNPNFYGLNNNISNYSDNIRILVNADVLKDGVTTNYVFPSEKIEVTDYEDDGSGNETFTCEINTLDFPGNILENNIINDGYTEVRVVFTPDVTPTFSSNVDFTEVENTWGRYAHGNKYTRVSDSKEIRRADPIADPSNIGGWVNNQANTLDEFIIFVSDTYETKNSDLYDTTTTAGSILAEENISAFYGVYSLDYYENYQINGSMYSVGADDDGILYQVAFFVDDDGVEYTLSFAATTGGIDFNKNPDYNDGDNDETIFNVFGSGDKISPKYCLVYNFGKDDCQILTEFDTLATPQNWNTVGDLDFEVIRNGKDITVNVEWIIDAVTYDTSLTYDLNDNAITEKFLGSQRIGFGFFSQDQGGFRNVVLIDPKVDYYGILRIQPTLSPTDESKTELSTIQEAPSDNLLIQKAGDNVLANLEWVKPSFYLTAKINQDKIDLGENYDLSGQIRLLDTIV